MKINDVNRMSWMSTGSKKRLNAIKYTFFFSCERSLVCVGGNEPVLGRASSFFSLYFVFFRDAVLNLFRILLLSVYFLSYPPPRGQDSDTTAAVDEVGNTWLTKTVE